MAQQFKGQYDDEEVLFAFKKHPVVMRRGLYLCHDCSASRHQTISHKARNELFLGWIGGRFYLSSCCDVPLVDLLYFSVNIMTDQRFVQIVQKGFFKKRYSDIGFSKFSP